MAEASGDGAPRRESANEPDRRTRVRSDRSYGGPGRSTWIEPFSQWGRSNPLDLMTSSMSATG